ncbi:hypothetical protein BU15DRAFT_46587 [Melanogaster broomeanus]|nr:hypothetical protein BU15DRAFT_46587 [Melanogaster broomeanus]
MHSAPGLRSIQHVALVRYRYVAVVLNASKNPHRVVVAADITNAILKTHATDGKGAEYWNKTEQEEKLIAAFDKWERKGTVWSAAAQKVHQEQLKHVRKGCLTRRRQDIRSDGSRIEGSHKGWNGVQRAQPSGIVMLRELLPDFVLRRNLRIADHRDDKSPFITSTHGSHHISLTNGIATIHNKLKKLEPASKVETLPELPDIDSGEVFGLTKSDYSTTFNGLLAVKEELSDVEEEAARSLDFNNDNAVDVALHLVSAAQSPASCSHHYFSVRGTDTTKPAPSSSSSSSSNASALLPTTRQADTMTLSSNNDDLQLASPSVVPVPAAKRIRTMSLETSSSTSTPTQGSELLGQASERSQLPSKDFEHHGRVQPATVGMLESYFRTSGPNPLPSTTVMASKAPASSRAGNHPQPNTNHPPSSSIPSMPSTAATNTSGAPLSETPVHGPTRSQRLFALTTGIDSRSLVINGNKEFFLFMDMHAEFSWVSHRMTPKKWVAATEEYNRRLVEGQGPGVVTKNPQALLRKLGEIEPKLMNRIIKNDFKSKQNSEDFWRKHCGAVQLVKTELGATKPRKAQSCSRCHTIMYPGPEGSPLNHRRGYCADGVKQTSKLEALPPWPQPQGIFSDGKTFHPIVLLDTIKCLVERASMNLPGSLTVMEGEALSALIQAHIFHSADGHVLFRLFEEFNVDISTPDSYFYVHENVRYLQIAYLEQG